MTGAPPDDLIDALARGRLAPAEVGGLTPRELDAIFAVAAQRIELGRAADAADMLWLLVTLFPYSARYWRGLGVALQHLADAARARAAYDVALMLEPRDLTTRCYRAEVLAALGELAEALRELRVVAAGDDAALATRAQALLTLLPASTAGSETTQTGTVTRTHATGRFRLPDGRTLPLGSSRFVPLGDEPTAPLAEDTSVTARFYAVLDDTVTNVAAPEPLWADQTEPRGPSPLRREPTETAIVDRRPRPLEDRDTARIERRFRGPAAPAASVRAEITEVTAIVRRRLGVPISGDEA